MDPQVYSAMRNPALEVQHLRKAALKLAFRALKDIVEIARQVRTARRREAEMEKRKRMVAGNKRPKPLLGQPRKSGDCTGRRVSRTMQTKNSKRGRGAIEMVGYKGHRTIQAKREREARPTILQHEVFDSKME